MENVRVNKHPMLGSMLYPSARIPVNSLSGRTLMNPSPCLSEVHLASNLRSDGDHTPTNIGDRPGPRTRHTYTPGRSKPSRTHWPMADRRGNESASAAVYARLRSTMYAVPRYRLPRTTPPRNPLPTRSIDTRTGNGRHFTTSSGRARAAARREVAPIVNPKPT